MKTNINCVVFFFDPICPQCDTDYEEQVNEAPVRFTIGEIMTWGIPGCQFCGSDLKILDECEVRA